MYADVRICGSVCRRRVWLYELNTYFNFKQKTRFIFSAGHLIGFAKVAIYAFKYCRGHRRPAVSRLVLSIFILLLFFLIFSDLIVKIFEISCNGISYSIVFLGSLIQSRASLLASHGAK